MVARRHEAEFLFGLDAETGAPGPLDSPVAARFTVTCDEVTPSEATVSRIGPSGYGTIRVGCSPAVKNQRPQQQIEVFVDRGNLSYPFSIPRRPGAPVLEVDQSTVYGLGFGAPELTVSSLEEDGSPLLAGAALPGRFVASGRGISSGPLTIQRGSQRASVRVHPSGIGEVAVSAVLRDMSSRQLTISLAMPALPILSMLIGGTAGGARTRGWGPCGEE